MPLSVRDGTALRAITRVQVRDGTALREVTKIQVRDAVGLRTVFAPNVAPGAIASPSFASGRRTSNSTVTVTSRTVQVTVNGGVAPYTYAWSGTAGITPTTPTGSVTAFSSSVPPEGVAEGTFTCAVTDATGAVFTTNTVGVRLAVTGLY